MSIYASRAAEAGWTALAGEMDAYGSALTPPLLTKDECADISALYGEAGRFRSTIDMERYRFGAGQYRYFAEPFPEPVGELRAALYPHLLPIAREWAGRLGRPLLAGHARGVAGDVPRGGPDEADTDSAALRAGRLERAAPRPVRRPGVPAAGRDRPDEPGADYTGGEFLMVEQRARAQSRGTATLLPRGHGLVFATRDRPVRTKRGWSAAPMRHGVSVVRSGRRHTLGLVFHDAA